MPHTTRWIALSSLVLLVHLPWWTGAPGQRDAAAEPLPASSAPAHPDAAGSGYPAPQVDPSADPAPMPPTF